MNESTAHAYASATPNRRRVRPRLRDLVLIGALVLPVFTARAGEILQNGSFEEPKVFTGGGVPTNWFAFASTNTARVWVSSEVSMNGQQSCRFEVIDEPGAFCGLAQRFPAVPGRVYTFRVFVRPDLRSTLQNDSFGQISIEWKDEKGAELYRDYGPVWSGRLKPMWTRFEVTAVAPEEAVAGHAVITLMSGQKPAGGVFYVDMASLTEQKKK